MNHTSVPQSRVDEGRIAGESLASGGGEIRKSRTLEPVAATGLLESHTVSALLRCVHIREPIYRPTMNWMRWLISLNVLLYHITVVGASGLGTAETALAAVKAMLSAPSVIMTPMPNTNLSQYYMASPRRPKTRQMKGPVSKAVVSVDSGTRSYGMIMRVKEPVVKHSYSNSKHFLASRRKNGHFEV